MINTEAVRVFDVEALPVAEIELEAVPIQLEPMASIEMEIPANVPDVESSGGAIVAYLTDGEDTSEALCEVVGEIVRNSEEVSAESAPESIAIYVGESVDEVSEESTPASIAIYVGETVDESISESFQESVAEFEGLSRDESTWELDVAFMVISTILFVLMLGILLLFSYFLSIPC